MINIENLKFSYSKKVVFNDITLNLERGKIYGLLGQNGVGKTTLLKLISGLIKLKEGKCDVLGYDPFKREPDFLSDIFFIPEDYIAPDLTVEKFASLRGSFYPKYDKVQFKNLLDEFEVDQRMSFNKLSFGQQKKALIAFALSLNTKILLMDEPSNGLDIPSKSQLRKVIAEVSDENRCIIISTHQVRDLENLIDPIIILDKDGVLLNESVEKISQRLKFSLNSNHKESALHCEGVPGGYIVVEHNRENIESRVNIEALFNATLKNKQIIRDIFNK